jgi:predicted secreted hydrolase
MSRSHRSLWLLFTFVTLAGMLLAGCGSSAVADPHPSPSPGYSAERPARLLLTPPAPPRAVGLPADDAPHNDLTEWWYYNGHLQAADGREYGFEFVIFQINRQDFPPSYSSHFAITDIGRGTFQFNQREQAGGQPQAAHLIDLTVNGWTLAGGDGHDRIHAQMNGYTLDLQLQTDRPPALHNKSGYFEIMDDTGSYYYSRTRMNAGGTLTVDGSPVEVTGQAWFDHQWGNFFPIGGWDWFALQLDDGQDIMAWRSHDVRGTVVPNWGTLVAPDGSTRHIDQTAFTLQPTGTWTSPHTGGVYPSGWIIDIPGEKLHLTATPVLKDQALPVPQPYPVAYWEGGITITGTRDGRPITGQGYVELTGYAQAPSPSPSR